MKRIGLMFISVFTTFIHNYEMVLINTFHKIRVGFLKGEKQMISFSTKNIFMLDYLFCCAIFIITVFDAMEKHNIII